jgi:aspartate kinase
VALIVQKYGGTSVGDIEKIKKVASRVAQTYKQGNNVVVVLSAMAGETDHLINLACQIMPSPKEREYDVLVSTGEQVYVALLTMALHSLGFEAVSFLGYQIKIITDSAFSRARIRRIHTEELDRVLKDKKIAVVAGFQGVDEKNNVTTMGRGGSDTTAVALAVVLNADVCEIYTDVNGIYTTDPNICPDAKKLKKISYDEMLEMASMGAKVLQTRSVQFARKYGVTVHVRSSFSQNPGTFVTKEDKEMEQVVVSGVTYNKNEAKVTVIKVPDKPGTAAKIFGPISDEGIIVDMIIQNASAEGFTDLTFTLPKTDMQKALALVQETAKEIGAKDVTVDENIAKISIVGVGMRSHAGVASKMFRILSDEGINIAMISTSEIKISCVIDGKYTELAVRVLHKAFGLDEIGVSEEVLA